MAIDTQTNHEELSFEKKGLPGAGDVDADKAAETVSSMTEENTIDINSNRFVNANGDKLGIGTLSDEDPIKLHEAYGIFPSKESIKDFLKGDPILTGYREDALNYAALSIFNTNIATSTPANIQVDTVDHVISNKSGGGEMKIDNLDNNLPKVMLKIANPQEAYVRFKQALENAYTGKQLTGYLGRVYAEGINAIKKFTTEQPIDEYKGSKKANTHLKEERITRKERLSKKKNASKMFRLDK